MLLLQTYNLCRCNKRRRSSHPARQSVPSIGRSAKERQVSTSPRLLDVRAGSDDDRSWDVDEEVSDGDGVGDKDTAFDVGDLEDDGANAPVSVRCPGRSLALFGGMIHALAIQQRKG